MNALSFLAVLACALYIETGYRALVLDHRGRKNRSVFALCLVLALWAIAEAFIYADPVGLNAGRWYYLANITWLLFVGAGTQFCFSVAEPRRMRPAVPVIVVWSVGLALAALYSLRALRDPEAGSLLARGDTPGFILWLVSMAYFLVFLSLGLAVILMAMRKAQDRFDRKRLGLLALSIALPCSLAVVSDAIVPALGFPVPRLGILWCLLWAMGVRIDMDRYGLMSPFHDMTDAGRLFAAFLDKSRDGIVVCSDSGRIALWSRALERISGIPASEAIGHDVTAISNGLRDRAGADSLNTADVRAYIEASLSGGGAASSPRPLLNSIVNRQGEERWLQSLPFVIALSGGRNCVAAVIRDVTEERKAEQAASEERKRLERAEKLEAVGDLAAGLAHSFSNMIMGIKGTVSVLRLGVEDGIMPAEAELVAALDQIDAATERGVTVLKQILGLARKIPLERKPLRLADAVEEAVSYMDGRLDPSVSIKVGPLPPGATVMAEAEEVVLAICNLLENAIESMTTMSDAQARGGTIHIAVFPADEFGGKTARRPGAEHGYWTVSVRDEGVGIREEDLSRLFAPFYTTKQDSASHGLGLSMVYIMAESHGGFVDVRSEPGKGSEFLIYLPRWESDAARPD